MDDNPQPDLSVPPVLKYKKTANQSDPMINFQVNNPIPPIKRLLKKLFGNEEITIKIPVLTAIAIVAFGLGGASGFLTAIKTRLAASIPVVATIFPTEPPLPTPNPWVSTTLFGMLSKQSSGGYFLVSQNGEAIKLTTPANVNIEKLVGKRILATGLYNATQKEMHVEEASSLLLFNSTAPVPTSTPMPSPSQTPKAVNDIPDVMY